MVSQCYEHFCPCYLVWGSKYVGTCSTKEANRCFKKPPLDSPYLLYVTIIYLPISIHSAGQANAQGSPGPGYLRLWASEYIAHVRWLVCPHTCSTLHSSLTESLRRVSRETNLHASLPPCQCEGKVVCLPIPSLVDDLPIPYFHTAHRDKQNMKF